MNPAANDDDLVIRPPEGLSREELERLHHPPRDWTPQPESRERPQFSIRDLMILTGGIGVALAGGSWMPADVFAAVLGVATLVGLLFVTWDPPETRTGKLVWTMLVVAYVVAVIAAILKPQG